MFFTPQPIGKRLGIGVRFGLKFLTPTWLNVWRTSEVLCVCVCVCIGWMGMFPEIMHLDKFFWLRLGSSLSLFLLFPFAGCFVWWSLSGFITSRVDRPITNCLPMTKHFGTSFSLFFILSDLKCYKSAFSSSTNLLWNAKLKEQPKKSVKEICFFKLENVFFFILLFHFQTS
jgi:hypothetical protein